VKLLPLLLLLAATSARAALDAEGVAIGASEADVKKQYPSAYCKPLEWPSRAADRRCDDGKGRFAGASVRITFYLKKDAVEAFDVRFSRRDAERIAAALAERYGKPASEERDGKGIRLEWREKPVRALFTWGADKGRGQLLVSRGDFEAEIYKVR
jgi:hypothetical protein